jgi:hypothetical protein
MRKSALMIDSLLTPGKSLISFNEFEEILDYTDLNGESFFLTIAEILNSPFWRALDYPNNPYKILCLDLAKEIDSLARIQVEPAYHSRLHFKDVCLIISCLLMQEENLTLNSDSNTWLCSTEEKWLLLLAAIAHDFYHPGLINKTPLEIEKNSLRMLELFLTRENLNDDLKKSIIDRLTPWILATHPDDYLELHKNLANRVNDHESKLAMLLVEADLFSSSLPTKGLKLSARLAEELKNSSPSKSDIVKSTEGRLAFLKHIKFVSPHALALKFEEIRKKSIADLT